jgi:iron complex outermembrane receptor protein
LGTFSYNAKWYSPAVNSGWSFIAGSQGMYQKNVNNGEEVLVPDARTVDFGAFVTSDYYYSERSYWQAGIRFDVRSIDGDRYGSPDDDNYIPEYSKTFTSFNFSTGICNRFSPEISLRANLSSGFRAPNMFELLSNGIHEGTGRYEMGNSDLKSEVAYQADASLDFQNEHVDVFVNPFINYVNNFIYLEPSADVKDDLPVYYYRQTNAYLFGGEAGIHFHPHPSDWLHVEASYAGTFGRDVDRNYLPLMPSQKIRSTIRTSFESKSMLKMTSLYLQYQYSFKQNRTADYETATPAYNLVSVGMNLEFKFDKQRLILNAGIDNLFNEVYFDHLSRYKTLGIYNPGRNAFVRLTLPFGI